MSTPFQADAGTYQGRILSGSAIQGSYVYELGHALAGQLHTFEPGDSHEVEQTADVTGIRAVRATFTTRGTTTMPEDAAWQVSIRVDGVAVVTRTLDARSLVLTDLAANLHGAGLSGNHDIAFVLEIVGGTGPYMAELPGCAVDAVVADEVGLPIEVMNRSPEPGETRVPVGGPFVFHVESTSGSADPDQVRTLVSVDGVEVYDGSTFAAGWTGSSVTTTASDGLAFELVPDAPLSPSAAHTISVYGGLVGGPEGELQESWVFSTVDTVSPTVTSALALREKDVRVVFSESMTQGDGSTAADALRPANYTITLVGGWPAVTPVVVGVETDGADRVVLTLDTPMTRRATYLVTVTSAADLNGNSVGPPNNSAYFIGYSFPALAARDFDLYRRWVTEDQKAQDAAQRPNGEDGDLKILFSIWQEPIDLLLGLIDKVHEIYDPDLAPEAFVDLMLVEMGNPFEFAMTATEKRRLVQILVPIYQSKGTGPGIVDAIRLFMGIEVTLNVYAWSPVGLDEAIIGVDWILGSSDEQDLLTFQVLVPQVLTAEERSKMRQIVDYMMDTREFFVILEPEDIVVPDHWQLGYSNLDVNTYLH